MALTRSFLKGMGLTEEQVSAIVEAHTETTNALKVQRDNYKADADKLNDVQRELDDLKAKGDGGWQEKYESEHLEFEKYKKGQSEAKAKADKVEAFKNILKEIGVSENRIDSIVKVTSLDGYELKDGKFENVEDIKQSATEEWKDFIVSSSTEGKRTETPPGNAGGKVLTKEEIYKTDEKGRYVLTTEERQQALVRLNTSK